MSVEVVVVYACLVLGVVMLALAYCVWELRLLSRAVSAVVESERRAKERTMTALDDLTAAVAANTTVTGSVLTLISGIVQELKSGAGDPTKIEALVAQLTANNTALASAVSANTPAAPPAPPTPPPAPPAGGTIPAA